MQCPDCSGAMWDNRENKRNPKSPDFKCKNQACGKAVWEKKDAAVPQSTNGNGASRSVVGRRPLGPLYFSCMKVAAASVHQICGDEATPGDIIAATATLFIQAAQTGAPVKATAEKAKPVPPPPPPTDEPQWQEDDDLPF